MVNHDPAPIRPRLQKRCYAVIIGVTLTLIALQLFLGSRTVSLLVITVIVVSTLGMICLGVRWNRPLRPLPWYVVAGSAFLFAAGMSASASHLLDDVSTLVGYCGMGVAALLWLRPRQAPIDGDQLLDSVLIGLGALLASWTFLISPILRMEAASPEELVTAAAYPVIDALLLTAVAYSAATTPRTEISARFLQVGLLAMLCGGVLYNLTAAGTLDIGWSILPTPLLLAYPFIGIAALHPTMATLGTPQPIHPHHSRQRASILAVALIVASLIPVVGARLDTLDRVIVSTLCALLLIGVLVRSERAIVRSTRSERRAHYQANHDLLTGLWNRTALLRFPSIDQQHWSEHPCCVLFIDLDGFKLVNDNHGHAAGDELITYAASRIRHTVRSGDVVARYGGDEFVVVAPVNRAEAAILADRLLEALYQPFELSSGQVLITASIGLACAADAEYTDIYALVQDADSAMYRAKEHDLGYAFAEADADSDQAPLLFDTDSAVLDTTEPRLPPKRSSSPAATHRFRPERVSR